MTIKEFKVTLILRVDTYQYDHPDEWSWPDILDMDYEDVVLEDVEEIN